MGEVYLAEDIRLGRRVAIKFLPSSYQYDPERRERFLREARAASALRSPNVTAVYDIGEHQGAMFMTMEYVEGNLLSRRLEHGPLSVGESISICTQVAEALDEAHAVGIVHRDIKGANVIITERGLVKVLDFGLSKMVIPISESDINNTLAIGKETMPGVILGTVAYMSPEQARGLKVDGRSDIFSLGVLFYEMVTGKKPFDGATTSDLIVSILEKEPLPLAHYSTESLTQLQWIVSKMLRKDREARYQTARDLIVDLKNVKQELKTEILFRPDNLTISSDIRRDMTSAPPSSDSSAIRRRKTRKAVDSIAILPLTNASKDPNMEYLSDGITESLIFSLSRLPKLRVMARSTVFRYKDREIDPQMVGHELNVRAVMTGRVFQIGDNLIIGAELVDVTDGSNLWGEKYNRKMADILSLQEEISNDITDKLSLKLSGKEKQKLTKRHTDNAEAYELYLKGRYHWSKWTEEGFRKAIEYFEEALAKDPEYALAYSGLGDAYGSLSYFANDVEAMPKAKEAVKKALQLDDTLAEAHILLAGIQHIYEWNWKEAERGFKRAIKLNPSFAIAHGRYSVFLTCQCRFDEAMAEIELARHLDPLSLPMNRIIGWVFLCAGKYDEAIDHFRMALDLEPDFHLSLEGLATALEQKGIFDEAVNQYLKMLSQLSRGLEMESILREAYAEKGMEEFRRKFLEFALQLAEQRFIPPLFIASTYALLGENDLAIECLEKAYHEHSPSLIHIKADRRLENLHSDPRFLDLVRRMGLSD